MIIILVGKTCSGKTTAAEKLRKKEGIKKVVTCTTRPKRKGEVDGADYFFLTDEKFRELENEGKFAETAEYVMAGDRHVSYGSLKKDYQGDEIKSIILNPKGLKEVKKNINRKDIFSVYIEVPERELKRRLKGRGDSHEEAVRRLAADRQDFADIRSEVDLVIDGTMSPDELASLIWNSFLDYVAFQR